MKHTNQEILTHFFEAIVRIVSEGTSDTFTAMILMKFDSKNRSDFPFVKYINIGPYQVKIDKKINSVNSKLIGEYITKLIDSLFSHLFKHLLKRKMDAELYKDLKKLSVKI